MRNKSIDLVNCRDVKRTSNLRTAKFIFEFGILTFDIRVKFALEQIWALRCLRTRRDVFVLCRRLTPAASPSDCHGLRRHCWCLITPPPAPHLYSVAICLSVRTVWLLSCQSGPKKLYIFQHTVSLKTFKIKWNGFHQNVPRVSGNKE